MRYGPNAGYPVTRSIIDPELQLKEMDRVGIDVNVVTMNIPGVERVEPELGLKQARLVNDSYAQLMGKYPDRFVPFATLPFQDKDLALRSCVGRLMILV